MAFGGAVAGYDDYEDALAAASAEPFDRQPAGLDMQYSSGTTGLPKGVRAPLPDRQVTEPGDLLVGLFAPLYGFDADTVYLSPAPLYHAAPLRFGGVIHATGGTVVILTRFDATAALAAIEKYRGHAQPVGADDVRPDAEVAGGGPPALRPVQPEGRDPRRGTVPGRG